MFGIDYDQVGIWNRVKIKMMSLKLCILLLPGRIFLKLFTVKKDFKLVSVLFATNNYIKSHIKDQMLDNFLQIGSAKEQIIWYVSKFLNTYKYNTTRPSNCTFELNQRFLITLKINDDYCQLNEF